MNLIKIAFTLFFLWGVLQPQISFSKCLRFKHIITINRGYANDGDCHDNLLFQFHSQNTLPEGDFHGLTLVDLKHPSNHQFVHLGFNPNFHNSSISFSKFKYAPEDKYPVLYASENYAPNNYYKILGYRILPNATNLVLNIVQTINMPNPSSLGILYPHAFLDEDNIHLWIEGYSKDKSQTVFHKFLLPSLASGKIVNLSKPLATFRIPRKKVTDQAICMHNGKFFQIVGTGRELWLRIIDPVTGALEKDIDLDAEGLAYEPEAIFFRKKQMYITFNDSGKTHVYSVTLRKHPKEKLIHKIDPTIGHVLPSWKPGELDIHAINHGRGESMFYIFPDGTTMLCDVGGAEVPSDARVPATQAKPNKDITAGKVVSDYIKHFLPDSSHGMLDYFLLTHYHSDHMGCYRSYHPLHESKLFRMNGVTEVGVNVPFRNIIDRGNPEDFVSDCALDNNSPPMVNYRHFIQWSQKTYGTVYQPFRPGVLNQIVLNHGGFKHFSIRNIAGNGFVWTGHDSSVVSKLPTKQAMLNSPREAWIPENILSCCLHLHYGKFDWFCGGDIQYNGKTKYPWKDIEAPISKVVTNVEGMKACHHGTNNANGEKLLRALYPDIFVVNTWRDVHPFNATLERLLRINPVCDIYSTNTTDANVKRLQSVLEQIASLNGHIVIRVSAGGDSYKVYVLDDTNQDYIVKSVSQPYSCR